MKTRIIGAIVALVLAGVGAFVLFNYVTAADARAAEGAELARVYVVTEAIPDGTPGESVRDYIEVDQMPSRNVADGVVSNLDDLAGLVASAEILPGEQLLEARWVDPAELAAAGDVAVPAGMHLVSFTLPADRVVGGQVRAGHTIGLVGTVDPDEVGDAEDVINPITELRLPRRAGDEGPGRGHPRPRIGGSHGAIVGRLHHGDDRALRPRRRALGLVRRGRGRGLRADVADARERADRQLRDESRRWKHGLEMNPFLLVSRSTEYESRLRACSETACAP